MYISLCVDQLYHQLAYFQINFNAIVFVRKICRFFIVGEIPIFLAIRIPYGKIMRLPFLQAVSLSQTRNLAMLLTLKNYYIKVQK